MKLWRIATETRNYAADDLSGMGAARNPGRWNQETEAVVYTAPTIAMAVLETAAHISEGGLPLNRFLVEIDVPEPVWRSRAFTVPGELPTAWCAIPAGRASVAVGSHWLRQGRTAILVVPSVVVPEEGVTLINPSHGDTRQFKVRVLRQFHYNRLFR
ncbi:hypothetical protein CAL12_04465 [Bordetella genomosp. 8]|uniref:RES domain-containing protein n=1 Tax=Bordetella genomosp. 8 TaxID=1416806 RepID=A0A1W6YGN2_9BORD|nr:RES family NAD+ phosphorylase [Bordetella genomosp. 8]ARP80154.1 hypothetical protein CAL12_04465 [Bordetella genomosp. 8]